MINIVKAIFNRSSMLPATSLGNPDTWLQEVFGGSQSSSGVNVNRRTALTYPAIWRFVNLLARSVGKTPLLVWKRLPGGGKERDVKHPAFSLLHRLAAPNVTSFIFKQTLEAHADLNGNGYAFIQRRGDASPKALLILDPEATYPVRENGVLWYVTTANGEMRKLRPRNVLHIKGLGYDGIMGYSVVEFARESFGLGLSMQGYSSRYFKSNASPGVVLEHPAKLSEEARNKIRADWDRMHSGLDQSHRTAVLHEGMKANSFTNTAKESQFAELWQNEIRNIASWAGLPPHTLGDPTTSAYASLEIEKQAILDEVDGHLVGWEQECTDKLMTEEEKADGTVFCEFLRAAFVRADLKTRTRAEIELVNNGLLSPDEAREIENRNPLPNGEGKKFRKPLNIGIVGEEEDEPDKQEPAPAPNANDDDDDDAARFVVPQELLQAHRGLVIDATRRIGKRIALHAKKAARKPDGFGDWVDRMEGEHLEVFVDMLSHAVLAIRCVAGGAASWTANDLATHYFGEIREELLTASECQPTELGGRVTECTRGLEDTWPERLADELMEHSAAEAAVTS